MRFFVIAALLITIFPIATPAHAWGYQGHRITGLIATAELTPQARSEIRKLVGSDDLSLIATWADEHKRSLRSVYPRSDRWHFINWPVCGGDDPARYCPQGNCVVEQIEPHLRRLSDTSVSADLRADSLRFVVHLMGDIHQPLHVGDNQDLNGNKTYIRLPGGERRVSLHALWDSELLKRRIRGHSEPEYASNLAQRYRQALQGAELGSPDIWANESRELAKQFGYLTHSNAGECAVTVNESVLTQDAVNTAGEVIDQRLAQAGYRLAFLLNAVFRH